MRKIMLLLLISGVASAAVPPEAIRTVDTDDICYTRTDTVRHVTAKDKAFVYARDGVPGGNYTGKCAGDGGCEVDHRVSLWLGGSNDRINLMVQAYFGSCNAHQKDRLEMKLHKLVCVGSIPVPLAQDILYYSWEEGYKMYVDPSGCRDAD